MSHCQNVTLSDELTKRKMKIADMEWELAAEHKHVRKEEEEEERTREAAEAWRQAATVLQQQARENQSHVELPRRSASPVASHCGASGSLSQCMSSFYFNVSHGVARHNCCS